MNNESERLADQLKRAFEGDAWHGPSLDEALAGVTAAQAIAHPIADAHSIWEIVAHISGWEDVIARRLTGEAIAEPIEGDFPSPPPNASDADWAVLRTRAHERHNGLVAQMAALSEADLLKIVAGKPYPIWMMAHGAVSHALYHTGQIVLLKKLL
ncbi:MAG TPA: DinB family protein [Bryobacteraceae bacterium]|jgi:uncharacterized damage-inducible protein DinB